MTGDSGALYRLLSWLSPSFPVGAYAFSHGLEWQIEHHGLTAPADVEAWIGELILRGSGQIDLVFCASAWRASGDAESLARINALALAFAGTAERLTETTAQGRAFRDTVTAAWPVDGVPELPDDCAYPVAVGVAARAHGIDLPATTTAYAHGFSANLVSAAVRLVPLGQTDGQRVTARLSACVERAVERALESESERVTSATLAADIASMNHETQYTRLFRS